jgi:Flp pilus assembly protein TadG
MLSTFFGRFLNKARSLRNNQNGNVAMMFGIAAIPTILAVGGFIDYERSALARAQMQDALDATALALHTDAATMTQAQMNDFATKYFAVNFANADAVNVVVTPTYSSSGPTVTVTGSAKVNTKFLPIIGINQIDIGAQAVTTWGQARLRVALVLDNTLSMNDDGKMAALKTATTNLLGQLKKAATVDGDVYVSIIPFAKDVNADSANYTQPWVDFTDWDKKNGSKYGSCNNSGYSDQSSCEDSTGYCSRSQYTTKSKCQNKGYTWTKRDGKWSIDRSAWNGCIMDRDQDYDVQNTAPTSGSTLFPAEQYTSNGGCPSKMIGLTYDWDALQKVVDSMTPAGSTNQTIGLAWGWQSLTQSPFTIPAFDPAYTYKTVIILLTDGVNTENRWNALNMSGNTAVDTRERALCTKLHATDITIWTVQVNTGTGKNKDPTQQVLIDCASSSDKFSELTTADQIITTFDAIGKALSDLRLES